MGEVDESVLEGWRERLASARRNRSTLRLRGSGTKDFYAEGLEGEVMDLRGWHGIVDYEPSELVISVRCGTPLSEVEAALAARERIGGDAVATSVAENFWSALRHYRLPLFAADNIWRLSLPPAAAPADIPVEPLIDWGGALRWYANVPAEIAVRERAGAAQGTALHWRGAPPGGRFQPLSPVIARLHRRLKEHFDPDAIFNPGRLIAGL